MPGCSRVAARNEDHVPLMAESHGARQAAVAAAILESSGDAIISKSLDGTITSWNPGAELLYGYSVGEAIGRPISLLVPERHADDIPLLLSRIAQGQRVERYETVRRRKDGSLVEVSLTLSPIKDTNGVITGVSVIARDVTEQKRLHRELSKSHQKLERQAAELSASNADLEHFAYVASHDLAEPLRMVSSYVTLLARDYQGRLDEKADKYIHYAVDGAERMHLLIDGLLEYSRIANGDAQFVAMDSGSVLEDALQSLTTSIAETAAEVSAGPLPRVYGNPRQLERVFQNLISNALKYRTERTPRIEVSAAQEDARWRFSVRDNGLGIEPRHAERIFLIFQRLHSHEKYRGTGIGLAISKRIIERHGGQIWVEPADGGGSVFQFTLPRGEVRTT